MTFRVSPEIIARGQNGRLLGGCVNPNGGYLAACTPAGPGDGPTSGTITFRAVVQADFTNNFPSGDKSVDQGDKLTNNAGIAGANLDINTFAIQSLVEANAIAASLALDHGGPLAKNSLCRGPIRRRHRGLRTRRGGPGSQPLSFQRRDQTGRSRHLPADLRSAHQ